MKNFCYILILYVLHSIVFSFSDLPLYYFSKEDIFFGRGLVYKNTSLNNNYKYKFENNCSFNGIYFFKKNKKKEHLSFLKCKSSFFCKSSAFGTIGIINYTNLPSLFFNQDKNKDFYYADINNEYNILFLDYRFNTLYPLKIKNYNLDIFLSFPIFQSNTNYFINKDFFISEYGINLREKNKKIEFEVSQNILKNKSIINLKSIQFQTFENSDNINFNLQNKIISQKFNLKISPFDLLSLSLKIKEGNTKPYKNKDNYSLNIDQSFHEKQISVCFGKEKKISYTYNTSTSVSYFRSFKQNMLFGDFDYCHSFVKTKLYLKIPINSKCGLFTNFSYGFLSDSVINGDVDYIDIFESFLSWAVSGIAGAKSEFEGKFKSKYYQIKNQLDLGLNKSVYINIINSLRYQNLYLKGVLKEYDTSFYGLIKELKNTSKIKLKYKKIITSNIGGKIKVSLPKMLFKSSNIGFEIYQIIPIYIEKKDQDTSTSEKDLNNKINKFVYGGLLVSSDITITF